MPPIEIVGLISSVTGIAGVTVGGVTSSHITKHCNKKAQQRYQNALESATGEGERALCISIGGRSAPNKDLAAYLSAQQPGLDHFLYYETPDGCDLADPVIACRVRDDLVALMREIGQERTPRLHLFLNGMVTYPFLLGALAGNTTPTVVYFGAVFLWRDQKNQKIKRPETEVPGTPEAHSPRRSRRSLRVR